MLRYKPVFAEVDESKPFGKPRTFLQSADSDSDAVSSFCIWNTLNTLILLTRKEGTETLIQ